MKKIAIIFIIFFSLVIAEEIEVTTWNLGNFGATKLENQDVMDKVVTVLEDSDVICLQEINQIVDVRGDNRNSAEILKDQLSQKTGVEWKLTLSGVTGEGGKKERYAFLWKDGLGKLVNSEIVRFNSEALQTERGYFSVNFDFRGVPIRMVSLHAKASGRVAERKLQWEEMANDFINLPQATKLLVMGDLNMEHNNNFERNFSPFFDLQLETALRKGDLTTLKKDTVVDGVFLAKQVDYVFSKNVAINSANTEDFVDKFFRFGDDVDIAEANKVSDHLPVSVKFDIPDDFPETFKLATWRVRSFSSSSRDDREMLFIKRVAQKYDFLVMQDIKDEEAVERLVEKLNQAGKEYKFEVKLPYCFLWNSKFIKQLQPARFIQSSSFQRRPLFSSFKAGNFDFVVLTHHTTTRSLTERKAEVRLLSDAFKEVQRNFPNEQDILLAGCFNRPPRFSEWDELFEIPGMSAAFRKPVKTTISDTDVSDNFFFLEDNLGELGILEVDKFDEEIFRNDDREASRVVSGNRPCFLELDTTDDD
ncbi:endonuclease/exonuclease/phosphatase family protein [Candidatus Uabimicrobium sp. HlEnr_7]|uniref:endonuclease/exonuclease/phosphatase family protein n=1 Tax=Candidatus Uabimicrobium helgolandensis TaxID=3095367 RepID=UPI0035570105